MKKSMLAVATLCCATCFAQNTNAFVSASTGAIRNNTDLPANYSADSSATTWAVGGGYKFNSYWGVEGGYKDLGSVKYTGSSSTSNAKGNGWTYGAFATYPLTNDVDAVAKIGRMAWKGDITYSNHAPASTSGTNTYWGVGLDLKVAKQYSFVATYLRYDMPTKSTDSYELGVKFHF
jgi:OOP family OmpA-OmpF porin